MICLHYSHLIGPKFHENPFWYPRIFGDVSSRSLHAKLLRISTLSETWFNCHWRAEAAARLLSQILRQGRSHAIDYERRVPNNGNRRLPPMIPSRSFASGSNYDSDSEGSFKSCGAWAAHLCLRPCTDQAGHLLPVADNERTARPYPIASKARLTG